MPLVLTKDPGKIEFWVFAHGSGPARRNPMAPAGLLAEEGVREEGSSPQLGSWPEKGWRRLR
jgi:hypothetical protein